VQFSCTGVAPSHGFTLWVRRACVKSKKQQIECEGGVEKKKKRKTSTNHDKAFFMRCRSASISKDLSIGFSILVLINERNRVDYSNRSLELDIKNRCKNAAALRSSTRIFLVGRITGEQKGPMGVVAQNYLSRKCNLRES
jgi:hypothetical protein